MPKTLTTSKYKALLADLRRIVEQGRQRARRAVHQELAATYWEVGRRIVEEGLTDRAGYGEAVLEGLSEELGIDVRTLQQSILFFQTYKTSPRAHNLSWSHYRVLMSIKDDEQRIWYESVADKDGITRNTLAKWVKEGRFYEYNDPTGAPPEEAKLIRPVEPTYLYKALVERVIDGDTLLLRVDLGFQVWKEQRLRLADIDTPSLDYPQGQKARRYVLEALASVEFVMVKTHKIDIYGRYVGHVFYSTETDDKDRIFREGRYLNGDLVAFGLARKV